MSGRSALFIAAAVAVSALGCRSDDAPLSSSGSPPRAGSLPAGVVARVGAADIAARSIARIAQAQAIAITRARDAAVRDALFESEARARGLDREPSVRAALQVALARLVLHDIFDAAKRAGPMTDAELYDATQFHWLDVDRPPGFRTVHAVVRLDAKADAARRKDASAIAEAIRRALEPIAAAAAPAPPALSAPMDPDPARPAPTLDPLVAQFKQAAEAVPHQGFDVTIEPLPAVAADGRVLEPGDRAFDPDFARAAAGLERRGEISPLTVTSFGVHVIMLLERTPPRTLPADERRALLQDEVVVARARAAQRALLERSREGVVVERGVDALLAVVAVDR